MSFASLLGLRSAAVLLYAELPTTNATRRSACAEDRNAAKRSAQINVPRSGMRRAGFILGFPSGPIRTMPLRHCWSKILHRLPQEFHDARDAETSMWVSFAKSSAPLLGPRPRP